MSEINFNSGIIISSLSNSRPMNDKERERWNSPNEVAKRKQIMDDGVCFIPYS